MNQTLAPQLRRTDTAGTVPRDVEVLVVGAGQAGLAALRCLRERGIDCVAYERHTNIGDSWRRRFDSLVLFTPRGLCALPGLAHAGDPHGYPGKDEMGDYLERYAERFALPVVTGNGVARLARGPDRFVATLDSGATVLCRATVITSGALQRPRVPSFARNLAPDVQQLDAMTYSNPAAIEGRKVIVVGDGATGRQIALELAARHRVTLAVGRRRNFGPQRLFGHDTTALALGVRLLTADKATWAGRLVRAFDATPGLHLRRGALRKAGIEIVPRCVAGHGRVLSLAGGTERQADAVVYTIGYRDDTSWLDVPGAATADEFLQQRGVGPVPGLFYVGREWQTSRASALICGVHRDAEAIAARIEASAAVLLR